MPQQIHTPKAGLQCFPIIPLKLVMRWSRIMALLYPDVPERLEEHKNLHPASVRQTTSSTFFTEQTNSQVIHIA